VNTSKAREQLLAKLDNKEYRDAFIAEQIFTRLPMKIRFLRDSQELTQKQLGDRAGIAQTWVSKLEDPNYGKLTISTLLKVASALDVGLQIDFVPFSRVLNDAVRLSRESFVVPTFGDDAGLSGNQSRIEGTRIATSSVAATMGTVIAFPQQHTDSASAVEAPTPPRSASRPAQQQAIA
jgi:transcriptional regulator with XRE-family HTH domain